MECISLLKERLELIPTELSKENIELIRNFEREATTNVMQQHLIQETTNQTSIKNDLTEVRLRAFRKIGECINASKKSTP